MASGDIKQLEPLIKELSPSDEVKKRFYQTGFGSVVGQTFFLVGLLASYLGVVAVIYSFAKAPLQALRDDLGTLWFWIILAAPLACILLFQMLPTALRALREQRLRTIAIGGAPKPGYFRLQPYGESDHDVFSRLDGADREVLNWLKSTKSSLLYLSGASGVGKSSLLSAGVLPQLRDAGWTVVETRIFGDPIDRLRWALLGAKGIFRRKPANADTLSPRELLRSAADEASRTHAAPLLVVIDQFEEFLILHDEAGRTAFTRLLNDLGNHPIGGLRLLVVFRTDYRSLVFKLGLPHLSSGENWYEISAYNRSEATTLLQGGGQELSANGLDALFRGLDRIEDAPGLYRPITINMIGLVLETMGAALRGDASKLIQSYLTDSLKDSASRDFVKPVLAEMITESGTKEPRTEAELVDRTHFERWQVNATLADLARRGLVRRLEGAEATWEIAHDFLARMIGQLIGRLKPTLVERARPLVAPVALLGWAVVFVAILPFWRDAQQQTAEKALREQFGATIRATKPQGISIEFLGSQYLIPEYINDADFSSVTRLLERLDQTTTVIIDLKKITDLEPLKRLINLGRLDLSHAASITSLESLKGLTNLSELTLRDASSVYSLEPLKSLTKLSYLNLDGAFGITSLEPLKDLTNLLGLFLSGISGTTSLDPLKGLTKLSSLYLIDATHITSLEPLKGLINLRDLDLSPGASITSLEPLRGLTNLSSLLLSRVSGITSLEPLKGLTNLSVLYLSSVSGVTSLEPLKGLTKLSSLTLDGATNVTSLEPLKGLTNLHRLELSGATSITSLEPLKGLTNLSDLNLSGATGIGNLDPLKGLTNLSDLNLSGAIGITNLAPLKGMKVNIRGVNNELLATMN
jgi:hypothetical protein